MNNIYILNLSFQRMNEIKLAFYTIGLISLWSFSKIHKYHLTIPHHLNTISLVNCIAMDATFRSNGDHVYRNK